jgi:hypothetical protein
MPHLVTAPEPRQFKASIGYLTVSSPGSCSYKRMGISYCSAFLFSLLGHAEIPSHHPRVELCTVLDFSRLQDSSAGPFHQQRGELEAYFLWLIQERCRAIRSVLDSYTSTRRDPPEVCHWNMVRSILFGGGMQNLTIPQGWRVHLQRCPAHLWDL